MSRFTVLYFKNYGSLRLRHNDVDAGASARRRRGWHAAWCPGVGHDVITTSRAADWARDDARRCPAARSRGRRRPVARRLRLQRAPATTGRLRAAARSRRTTVRRRRTTTTRTHPQVRRTAGRRQKPLERLQAGANTARERGSHPWPQRSPNSPKVPNAVKRLKCMGYI